MSRPGRPRMGSWSPPPTEGKRGETTRLLHGATHAPRDMWADPPASACGKPGRLSSDPALDDVTCKACLKKLGSDDL